MIDSDFGASGSSTLRGFGSIRALWLLALVLCGLGVAALAIDVPVARWMQARNCPRALSKLCELSEVFSHALGVGMLVVALAVLDPARRFAIPRILAASLGSGILADILKLLVARTRPRDFNLDALSWQSFAGWLPLFDSASREQSFPSSHLAVAAGLAIVLAYYYPRGRLLFPAMVLLAAGQRMVVEAHFTSDVLWGAAVGCFFAPLCVYGSGISRALDRVEAHWKHRWPFRGDHSAETQSPCDQSPPKLPRAA